MERQSTVPVVVEEKAHYEVRLECRCESCNPSKETNSIHIIYNTLVSEAIAAYADAGSLHTIPQRLIRYLPIGFIATFAAKDVEYGWHLLPKHVRNSFPVAICRRCTRHFAHRSENRTDFDGVLPMIKECKKCQLEFPELVK